MAVFTYIPDKGMTKNATPVVLMSQFGDGYSQRTSTLINNEKIEWNLNFKNRNESEISNIIDFLAATKGEESFDWTPPGESSQVRVIATKWNKTYITDNISSLSTTFQRVYE